MSKWGNVLKISKTGWVLGDMLTTILIIGKMGTQICAQSLHNLASSSETHYTAPRTLDNLCNWDHCSVLCKCYLC